MRNLYGRVHSIETLGTRDGPGLRCVFFMAGCNFRCRFCHNPDTFTSRGARRFSLAEARETLSSMLPYLRKGNGGVTASGGEPSLQPDFVTGLFRIAHEAGLSTALDTNGSCCPARRAGLLKETDIVLLDVKASEPALHRRLTGASLHRTLEFGEAVARLAAEKGKPVLVVRRVLLPGINDKPAELARLAAWLDSLAVRPVLELIPYHTLGVHKWKELGLKYTLHRMRLPTRMDVRKAAAFLAGRGFKVAYE